jgi:hypothetical protein
MFKREGATYNHGMASLFTPLRGAGYSLKPG